MIITYEAFKPATYFPLVHSYLWKKYFSILFSFMPFSKPKIDSHGFKSKTNSKTHVLKIKS